MTRGPRGLLARTRSALRRAARGLRGSPLTSVVATLTIAVTLVLAGTFALVVKNMQGLLAHVGEEVGVSAYLAFDLTPDGVEALAARAEGIAGVGSVRSVSREEAARRFAAQGEERAAWLEALGDEVLPASLEVSLRPEARTQEGVRAVAEALRALPGVEDVVSEEEWAQGYARSVELVRAVGLVLGVVLALATLLIVANTIRLAIHARRDEIEILSLVGASRSFIALPFLLEGAFQGIAGGAVAVGLLALLFRLVQGGLAAGLAFLLGSAEPAFLTPGDAALLVAAGAALGVVGAGVSLAAGWRG